MIKSSQKHTNLFRHDICIAVKIKDDIYMTITSAQGRVPRDLCDHQRKKKHTHNDETSVVVTVR